MDIGHVIQEIRKEKKIKQQFLAEKAELSQTYLSQIENNIKEPTLSTLQNIANALDIPLPILLILSMNENDIKPEKRAAYLQLEDSLKALYKSLV